MEKEAKCVKARSWTDSSYTIIRATTIITAIKRAAAAAAAAANVRVTDGSVTCCSSKELSWPQLLRNKSSNKKNAKSDNSDQAVNSLGLLQHWDHGIVSFYRPVCEPNVTCVVALPCNREILRPRKLPNISTDCLRNQTGIRQSSMTAGNQKELEWFIIVRT